MKISKSMIELYDNYVRSNRDRFNISRYRRLIEEVLFLEEKIKEISELISNSDFKEKEKIQNIIRNIL